MWLINLLKLILSLFSSSQTPDPIQPKPTAVNVPNPDITTKDTSYIDDKVFNEALTLVLQYEGGYSDNPADHGGATNKGIIQREYDAYRTDEGKEPRSVLLIGNDEVKDIYYNKYWAFGKCPLLPPDLAIVHFDTCVNCGPHQAAKFLQRAISVNDDGIIGPGTISALNTLLANNKDINIIHLYLEQRANFYYKLVENDPSQKLFLKGWQNRIEKLTAYISNRDSSGTVPA